MIGFEGTVLVRLALDEDSPLSSGVRLWAFSAFAGALLFQFLVLVRLLRLGYTTDPVVGPAAPIALAQGLIDKGRTFSAEETLREIGAHYGKSYETLFPLGSRLWRGIVRATIVLLLTLIPFAAGVALLGYGALWQPREPVKGGGMVDTPSTTTTSPAPAGSAATSADSPSTTAPPTPPPPAASPGPAPQAPASQTAPAAPFFDTSSPGQDLGKAARSDGPLFPGSLNEPAPRDPSSAGIPSGRRRG